jgi:methyl-accepting chemotaxis protein
MLSHVKVSHKIWGMLALFVLGLLSLSAYDIYSIRDALLSEKKLKTRHLVESAHSVAGHYASEHRHGNLSLPQAQQAALQVVNQMRYQGAEYFWINDLHQPIPKMVMHPTVPRLNGQILDDPAFNCATSMQFGIDGPVTQTDGQKNLFVAFNEVVNRSGEGYVNYLWPKPLLEGGATEERYPKLSYVKKFDDWGWVFGSGIYIDDVDLLIEQRLLHEGSIIFAIAVSLILVGGFLASSISRRLIRSANELQAMTKGQTPQAPLNVGQDDEIGTLINGFNQMQAALLAKEDSLRLSASVFENTNEAIVITNPEGLIVSINPSYTRLTGYTKQEALAKTPTC